MSDRLREFADPRTKLRRPVKASSSKWSFGRKALAASHRSPSSSLNRQNDHHDHLHRARSHHRHRRQIRHGLEGRDLVHRRALEGGTRQAAGGSRVGSGPAPPRLNHAHALNRGFHRPQARRARGVAHPHRGAAPGHRAARVCARPPTTTAAGDRQRAARRGARALRAHCGRAGYAGRRFRLRVRGRVLGRV